MATLDIHLSSNSESGFQHSFNEPLDSPTSTPPDEHRDSEKAPYFKEMAEGSHNHQPEITSASSILGKRGLTSFEEEPEFFGNSNTKKPMTPLQFTKEWNSASVSNETVSPSLDVQSFVFDNSTVLSSKDQLSLGLIGNSNIDTFNWQKDGISANKKTQYFRCSEKKYGCIARYSETKINDTISYQFKGKAF
jgi:hypothetical protein